NGQAARGNVLRHSGAVDSRGDCDAGARVECAVEPGRLRPCVECARTAAGVGIRHSAGGLAGAVRRNSATARFRDGVPPLNAKTPTALAPTQFSKSSPSDTRSRSRDWANRFPFLDWQNPTPLDSFASLPS